MTPESRLSDSSADAVTPPEGIRRASLVVEAYCQQIEARVESCEKLWDELVALGAERPEDAPGSPGGRQPPEDPPPDA